MKVSSVNVTKSAGNWWFGHIYWRNPSWKTSFFVQCRMWSLIEFCVRFSPLFLHITVIGCFMWLGNCKLDVGVPKAPFSVLFFSCYLLMTFQVKLFTIMLWMMMKLLSSDMWQQFKFASELDPDLFSVDFSKSADTILWKWSGLFVIKKAIRLCVEIAFLV